MERAAGGNAAGGTPAVITEDDQVTGQAREDSDEQEPNPVFALNAFRWMWGEFYEFTHEHDTSLWLAKRTDGLGTLEGATPDKLRIEVIEDWLLRPVVVRR